MNAAWMVLAASPVLAQTVLAQTPPRAFKLADLETMALAGNPSLAQADAGVRAARGRAKQAGLYPNPVLGATGDHNTPVFDGGGLGGFAEQRIVIGGKLGLSRRAADEDAAAATELQNGARMRVLTDIRRLYYRGLGEQRLVEVRKQMADSAARTASTFVELNNIGQADLPDQFAAEIEAQRAALAVTMAENALARTWREIAAVVNQPALASGILDGDLEAVPELDAEPNLARLLNESPELRAAQAEATRSATLVKRARIEKIPDVSVRGGVRYNREPLFPVAPEPGRPPAIVGNEGFFDVGVEIPLFNRNQGTVTAAEAEAERARLEVDRRRIALRRRFATVFAEYSDATAALARYKDRMLPRARQALDLYRANFRQMSAPYTQILAAERSLIQIEDDYVAQLMVAWQSVAEIEGLLVDMN
jgi:cobalt-zinc-cadmium efflux system outer membrane protein